MGYGRKNKKNYPPPSSALRSSAKCLQRMAPVRAAPFSLPPASRGMASIKASFQYITISDLRKKNHHRPGFQVRAARVARAAGSRLPLFRDPRFKSGAAAGGRRGAAERFESSQSAPPMPSADRTVQAALGR